MLNKHKVEMFSTEVSTFFCKGPDSKYCRLCRPCMSVATTRLCHCNVKAAIANMSVNKCDCSNIWTMKLEFHVIFKCHEILFF